MSDRRHLPTYTKALGRAAGVAATLAFVATAPALALDEVIVRTSGNNESLTETVRNASLSVSSLQGDTSSTQDVVAAARADYGRILGALYGQGYYAGVISIKVDGREAADIPPFSPPARVSRIVIDVQQGEQFKFSRAEVAPLAKGTELPNGFAKGEIARSGVISSAANAGIRGWRNQGHAKAELKDQSVRADNRAATLDTQIELAPGPKLTFGALTLDNRGKVRDKRVLQIAGYPEGTVYSPDEVNEVTKRLRRTGTFSTANLTEAEEIGPNDTLPMLLTVDDQLPRRFGFGAEISSSEGLSLTSYWKHRNLFGGAETLDVRGEIANIGGLEVATGGVDYFLGARLTRPAIYGPDTNGNVFASIEQNDDPGYFERKAVAGVSATRIFSDDLEGELGLGFRYSQYDDDFGEREFTHFVLPVKLEWDKRNSELEPTRDFYLRAEAEPFVGVGNESSSGAQLFSDLRGYLGFGEKKNFVLAGRLQLGSVVGPDLSETPPDYLFFSGGAGTVRGHTYQSLQIELPGDISTGGKSFVGVSLEARSYVTDSIGLVGFYDVGFIGPESYITEDYVYHSGIGVGVRYKSPIGPLRVDLGYPLEGDDENGDIKIYIGIGQAF
ncbi:Translocation and assembly module TamA precursor [Pseudoruegeria aquimaris]|uniref:Translocation and assembly module TamA n=1 Tax=Pseudoruegeria aquimaris TaxID=393663 RepID=A0A1Y5RAN0_9RHOB|nr:autotransporter assembly complex family protein [Pseudoruegeria aquimaris]SLN12291.1 Translocation and assembly module TamA precursor [Pseudoruegeria aquimaris]